MFSRTQHPISPTFVSGVKNPNIVTEFKEVEDTIKSGHTFQESFTKIVKNESNCSSTMFFKAKYVSNQYKNYFKIFLPRFTISSMCPKISYVLETIWRRLRKEECLYTIFWASSCQTTWPWWPDRTCLRTRQRWGAGYSVLYSPTLAPAADQPAGHDGQLQHAPHQRPRRARRLLPGQQCKYSFSPPQQQVGWR